MTQTKEELDKFYEKQDPWHYQDHPDDLQRRELICNIARAYGYYARALDLGAGEGWITQFLPAPIKHGYEISDVAAERFPNTVQRELHGEYDLVCATGVLYNHYEWRSIIQLIHKYASGIVLTCNIKSWEVPGLAHLMPGKQVFEAEFPYREFVQRLRVFRL